MIESEENQLRSRSKTSEWVAGKFLSQGKQSEKSAEARWNEAQRNRTGESAEAEAQVNPRDGTKLKKNRTAESAVAEDPIVNPKWNEAQRNQTAESAVAEDPIKKWKIRDKMGAITSRLWRWGPPRRQRSSEDKRQNEVSSTKFKD